MYDSQLEVKTREGQVPLIVSEYVDDFKRVGEQDDIDSFRAALQDKERISNITTRT